MITSLVWPNPVALLYPYALNPVACWSSRFKAGGERREIDGYQVVIDALRKAGHAAESAGEQAGRINLATALSGGPTHYRAATALAYGRAERCRKTGQLARAGSGGANTQLMCVEKLSCYLT